MEQLRIYNIGICLILMTQFSVSQSYYGISFDGLFKVEVDDHSCSCEVNFINEFESSFWNGITFTPDTTLIAQGGAILVDIDTLTGQETIIYTPPPTYPPPFPFWDITMICSIGNGIFYVIGYADGSLYRINVNSGSITYLGSTGFVPVADMTLYNGNMYYGSLNGIIQVDTTTPANSQMVVQYPPGFLTYAITASHICNSFLAVGGYDYPNYQLVLINIIDGAITVLCDYTFGPPHPFGGISSMLEFADLSDCEVTLDLDCNNSSGATGADYNAPDFNCLSPGVGIADEDIRMSYDDFISTMQVWVTGNIPDAPNEILVLNGGPANITVDGSGTGILTLTSTGDAKSSDFKDALRLVLYQNTAIPLTPGPRTVQVQFTTASGAMSNVATAFIEVIGLPLLDVDLGPDLQACANEVIILDAGHPGSAYTWSTGSHNQTIPVDVSGAYSVTVSDGVLCPNADTVEVEVVPVITVSLTGDTEICDNETAQLSIETITPFGLDITVTSDPGSPFHFQNVTGNTNFTDLINQTTTYTITNVTPAQNACIEMTDAEQIIEVYLSFIHNVDVAICEGDSTWLGFYWETDAGVYENTFNTIHNCDSVVTTNITILPSIQITQQSTTCHPSEAGVFITHLDNSNGCDTVVTTTISLLTSDTTMIVLSSCSLADTGLTLDTLTNQHGCDSLIITTTAYIPPADTTFTYLLTCDSTQIGVSMDILPTMEGCDSLVVTTTAFAVLDTTYLLATSCDSSDIGISHDTLTTMDGCDSLIITTTTFALADTTSLTTTSCNPSQVGVTQVVITGADGCDSLIITTTTFALADTTYLLATSCDASQIGVSQHVLTGTDGCDSLIITTTTLLPSNTVSIASTTCDPSAAGVFVTTLSNQYGCDSIITETIVLLPSDQITFSSTTCIAAEAGVFVTTLTNQYGCDSSITETITLIAGDTTTIHLFTCDPAQSGVSQYDTTGTDGCDSIIVEITKLFPLPNLMLQSTIDYNGFDISCIHDADGGAMAVIAGSPPYTYIWSTTDTDPQITDLTAGDYAVTITDANGCTSSAVITLSEPTALIMGFDVTEPDCFDQALGTIKINAIGGVPPYTYSKDGGALQTSNEFNALGDGIYQFNTMDANGCTTAEIISIDVPLMISVDLGSDQSISLGDTTDINAIVNLPLDSITSIAWGGIDTSGCINCLHQIVAPVITTAYSISLSSVDGCSDRDTMTVSVIADQHIYIPNIFSPNGDGVNDVLRISADDGVQEISAMDIFDRWGNLVFGFTHLHPQDPTTHWDGFFNGQKLNPGVFTYKAVILFVTGETEVRYGDITLLR